MPYRHYARTLSRHYRTVAIFAAVGLLASAIAVFSQPLRYGASVQLLVIQRSTYGLDPYTAVKSAGQIADNLSQVVRTDDFFSKVLKQDPTIDQSRFPTDPNQRRKTWQKTVRASLVSGTGLLSVTALSEDKGEAVKLAQAIADVLTVYGKDYIGGDLDIKVVNSPLASEYPISPDIPLGLGLGLGIGLLAGMFYVIWSIEGHSERHAPLG